MKQDKTMNDPSAPKTPEQSQSADSIAPLVCETKTKETAEKVTVEFNISGDSLVAKVKELIHAGNIRRIIIKHSEGQTLIEIPLTVGVVGGVIGAALFPVVTAVAVIGSMVAHLTIVVEKGE
jgi:Domain of unknown function (DUF4342)